MTDRDYKKDIRKNPYFLGVILGLVIGIFPLNQLFTDKLTIINDALLFLPRIIFNQTIECPLCNGVYFSVFILLIIAILLYILLALAIIFLFRKIKNIENPIKNK